MIDQDILDGLPQRPPFLFVDKIVERDEKRIHCRKTLTGKEDFFKGHFPGRPIMPGVLLQEAAFQAGSLLIKGKGEGLGVVSRVEKVKFKGLVSPPEVLNIKVELLDAISNAYYFKGQIYVSEKLVCSLHFTCNLIIGDL